MADPKTNLRVRISADLAQFQKGLGVLRKDVLGLNGMLAGALGGLTVAALVGGVIRATAESEKALAQLEARLKSTKGAAGLTKDELVDMATGLQKVTTYGDEAIIGAQSMLLTFTKIGRDVFPQATEAVLNMATAMGTDLQSAAVQIGKALNDPVKGVAALSKAGVQFTQSQKDLIDKLVESGKQMDAQKIILRELETQFGGAARAARDTMGGAFDALKEAAGDLLEGDSGSGGVRGVKTSIEGLTSLLQDSRTKEAFAKIAGGVFELAGAFTSLASEAVDAWESVQRWLTFRMGGTKGTEDLKQIRYEMGKLQEFVDDIEGSGPVKKFLAQPDLDAAKKRLRELQSLEKRSVLIFGDPDAPPAVQELSRTSKPGKGRWANVITGDVPPASEDDAEATKKTKDRTKAKKELTEAEKLYQSVVETNAIIDQAVSDAAAEQVIREGDLLVAKDEGIAATQKLIGDMEFELSLRGMTNDEMARAIALRGLDANATEEQRKRVVELTDALGQSKQAFSDNAVAGADMAIAGVSDTLFDWASGAKSFGDAFSDAVDNFAKGLLRMSTEAAAMVLVLKSFDAFMPGFSDFFMKMRGGSAGIFHQGGVVGAGGASRRNLNPLLFGAAPRYHSGGFAGLASDEVAAVLRKGEEVITEDDPRHARKGGKGRAGSVIVNVQNHSGAQAQTSERMSGGDRIIDVVIGAVADSISRNGTVGKAIGQRFGVAPVGTARG